MNSDLRDFLKDNLHESIAAVIDRPRPDLKNFVEEFVLETNCSITSELLYVMLQRYYVGARIVVTGESFHWIHRPDKVTLLINVTNYSEIGGAKHFGGNPEHGAICVTVTKHEDIP